MKTRYKIKKKNVNGERIYFLFYNEQVLERNILPDDLRPLVQDWLGTNNWHGEIMSRNSRTVTYEVMLDD